MKFAVWLLIALLCGVTAAQSIDFWQSKDYRQMMINNVMVY